MHGRAARCRRMTRSTARGRAPRRPAPCLRKAGAEVGYDVKPALQLGPRARGLRFEYCHRQDRTQKEEAREEVTARWPGCRRILGTIPLARAGHTAERAEGVDQRDLPAAAVPVRNAVGSDQKTGETHREPRQGDRQGGHRDEQSTEVPTYAVTISPRPATKFQAPRRPAPLEVWSECAVQ